jgi:hypothetical protein
MVRPPLNSDPVLVIVLWVGELNVTVVVFESLVDCRPVVRLVNRAVLNKISARDP